MRNDQRARDLAGWSRLLHWAHAFSIIGLMSSGWAIFNAAPFYHLTFPGWTTLGGDLTQALRWHFMLMWVFVMSSAVLVVGRLVFRRGGPSLLPVGFRIIIRELRAASRFRLEHDPGRYLHTQRLLYLGCFALFGLLILSGLVLWKPVQLQSLSALIGGYEIARRVHFWSMAALAVFILIHLAMVVIVPRTLLGMLFGFRVRAAGRETS